MLVRLSLALLLTLALSAAEDPAIALARILAGKGTISAADLAAVTAAADRVGALASILGAKGLLTDTELANFRPAPSPTINATAVPNPLRHRRPRPPDRPAISLYGTVLMNAPCLPASRAATRSAATRTSV